MSFSTLLFTTLALTSSTGWARYTLADDYMSGGNFFSQFSFFTAPDPTHGFVQYVSESTAQSAGYINASSSSVYIGTDHGRVASSAGRESVRITSNKAYNAGLFILDLAHMPGGECGTWPAFWTVGPNWPNSGEIDIIEGVNQQSTNDMTLHTSKGCTITNNHAFSGSISTPDCWINDPNQYVNAGCGITTANTQSYGAGFNANGGGVYAMEFASNAITVWFFPRGAIPYDVSSGTPNPSGWTQPVAQFQGGCNIPHFFNSQQIVFDLTFCGDWAGSVWGSSSCSSLASTCNAYVQNNPSTFKSAYWSINSLRVYQSSGTGSKVATAASIPGSTGSNMAISSSNPGSTLSSSTSSSSVSTIPSSFLTSHSQVLSSGSAITYPGTTLVSADNGTPASGPTATSSRIISSALTSSQAAVSTAAPAPATSVLSSISVTPTSAAPDQVVPTRTRYRHHGQSTHGAKRHIGRHMRHARQEHR